MMARVRPLLLHLSIIAILLLASVPTLGRLLDTQRTPDAAALAMRFCGSVDTPIHRLLALWQHEEALQRGIPDPGAGQHQDCEYCPLLAALVSLALLVLAWLCIRVPPLQASAPTARISYLYPSGLGSRGPPTTL